MIRTYVPLRLKSDSVSNILSKCLGVFQLHGPSEGDGLRRRVKPGTNVRNRLFSTVMEGEEGSEGEEEEETKFEDVEVELHGGEENSDTTPPQSQHTECQPVDTTGQE